MMNDELKTKTAVFCLSFRIHHFAFIISFFLPVSVILLAARLV